MWRPGGYAYDIEADSYALRARHSARLAGLDNVFVAGSDYSRWTRDVLGNSGSRSKASTHAFYLKDDLTLSGSRTRLSLGLRTERIEKLSSSSTDGLSDRQNAWGWASANLWAWSGLPMLAWVVASV